MPAARKQKGGKVRYSDLAGIDKLDARFCLIPDFTGLKRFTKFSAVKQWTGMEQKAIVQQIMPVLAPLLAPNHANVLDFCRALVDFILMAQYRSHDDATLKYLDQALMRINVYKKTLRDWQRSGNNLEGRFDFPKFHVMSHYPNHV